jgi:DNA-binding NarL/FixJ family response regulator
VLLADDHTMVREGMSEMLSTDKDIEVVGEAENGQEAVELARKLKPDVVILDIEMPVMGAQAALTRMLRISPLPKVIIVTVFADSRLVRELLGRGASAYLSKSASTQDLITTVRSVARGQYEDNVILSVPRGVLDAVDDGAAGDESSPLSRREMEILLAVARGMSNKQAAEKLHLSVTTVKRHLSNIYEKLKVSSRGEATRKAITEGWISSWDVTQDE